MSWGPSLWPHLTPVTGIHSALMLALPLLAAIAIRLARRSTGREIHRRGALIAAHRRWYRPRPAAAMLGRTTLAGVPIAPAAALKHFKLIGSTGTGKSYAIRELLAHALQRGDRAVISDP